MSEPLDQQWATPTPPSYIAKLGFMDLPLEIRTMILELSLISRTPLIAWSGMPPLKIDHYFWRVVFSDTPQAIDMRAYSCYARPVERQMTRMSLVSRAVSIEVARVFWGYNTFRFIGDWIWDTVLQWLIHIGPTNRRYLTRLEFQLQQQQHVWQLSEPLGARTQLELPSRGEGQSWQEVENFREVVYPRNKRLILPRPPLDDDDDSDILVGAVENISPKVDIVLKMLAEPWLWSKVRLTMLLPDRMVPGFKRGTWRRQNWMSMDLPNVIESSIEAHAAGGRKEIEVLWKCKARISSLRANNEILDECGWDVTYTKHENYSSLDIDWDTYFTMKRKKVQGPFVASLPSPHSAQYVT